MKKEYKFLYKIILTLFITWIYCNIWVVLEEVIDGQAVNRPIDNIMMVLFIPIIYIAAEAIIDWICTARRNNHDKTYSE